jgi:hypothetical protein
MMNPLTNPRITGSNFKLIFPPLSKIVIKPLCCFLKRGKLT